MGLLTVTWRGLKLAFRVVRGAFRLGKKLYRFLRPRRETRYASNWATVSRDYKESVGWVCEGCGVHLGRREDQYLLHVHHKNRDSLDNRRSNLVALCVQCHSKQPGVGHRRLKTAAQSDGRWVRIDHLRKKGRLF